MNHPSVPITRKNLSTVFVHTGTYEDERKPKPFFDGQRHAVLQRSEPGGAWNGGGGKFYIAEGGKWKETKL